MCAAWVGTYESAREYKQARQPDERCLLLVLEIVHAKQALRLLLPVKLVVDAVLPVDANQDGESQHRATNNSRVNEGSHHRFHAFRATLPSGSESPSGWVRGASPAVRRCVCFSAIEPKRNGKQVARKRPSGNGVGDPRLELALLDSQPPVCAKTLSAKYERHHRPPATS